MSAEIHLAKVPCNSEGRVIVMPTGPFGKGMPICLADYVEGSPIDPGLRLVTIKKPTRMLYMEGEHAEKIVDGYLCEEVIVTPEGSKIS